jgi:hypothetical protein
MDAIYSKSKESLRVERASSIVDIQNLPYQPNEIKSFAQEMELIVDTIKGDNLYGFALKNFGQQVFDKSIDSRINLEEYSFVERRRMIVMLFDALKLPLWVKYGLRKIYRIFLK